MLTATPAFATGAASHPGRVRTLNEDSFVTAPAVGLWAVADGVGGAEAGDVASRTLTDQLKTIGPSVSAADLLARFEERVLRAHQRIRQIEQHRGARGMGTTLAALLVSEGFYGCLWCGDSRVYRLREGALVQVTRDHSEAQDLLDRGAITAEEAAAWPRRHVITRAIGITADPELDLEQAPLAPRDAFLLCSDGLTEHVQDEEIRAVLEAEADPQAACDRLIALTLERGATDNVTVLVVRHRADPA